MFYLPMVMISGWLVSPGEVALAMLPLGIALTLLSAPAGKLTDRFGPGPVITLGALLATVSLILLAITVQFHSVWFGIAPLMLLFGIGMSGIAGPISTAVMGAVADGETGTASAINNAVARVAGLVAIAAMGGLALAVFMANMPEGSAAFGVAPSSASASAEAERARVNATDLAFALVCCVAAVLSAVAAGVSWFTLPRKF